jgi:hypothetical protein
MEGLMALTMLLLAGLSPGIRQRILWQADLQVRSVRVSQEKGNLRAEVVIATEVGEALDARVEVMLPVGVGIVAVGPGCTAGPSAPGLSALRARVACNLGNLAAGSRRALFVITTTPPAGIWRGFGVVAVSDTPDPKPGNNFAECALP